MNTTYYNWHKSFTLITKRVATSVTFTKYCSSTSLSSGGRDTQVSLVICRQGRAAWNVCEPHERCLLVHGWANRGLTHSAGHALSGITNLINGKQISTEPEPETVADGSFTCWCWCWWMFWSTPAAALPLYPSLFLCSLFLQIFHLQLLLPWLRCGWNNSRFQLVHWNCKQITSPK